MDIFVMLVCVCIFVIVFTIAFIGSIILIPILHFSEAVVNTLFGWEYLVGISDKPRRFNCTKGFYKCWKKFRDDFNKAGLTPKEIIGVNDE